MSDIPQKRCSNPDCLQWYPATSEFFHRDKTRRDGLNSRCKDCARKKNIAYKNRPEVRERNRSYNKIYGRTYKQRPEVRERERVHSRVRYHNDPDYRERRLAQDKVYKQRNPTYPEYNRAWVKAYRQTPEGRAHLQAYRQRPEVRERNNAKAKARRSHE